MKTSLLLIVGLCLVALATGQIEHEFKKCAKANAKNCQTCQAVLYAREHKECRKSENICKSIKNGECPVAKKLNPKFEYFTCADQKDKVLSVKNAHALHAEYRGAIAWAEFDDAVEAHYKCAVMECCKTYPKGGFEPFIQRHSLHNEMNTDAHWRAQMANILGYFASPEEDNDDVGILRKEWVWKPKEDSFIEKQSHNLQKN